MASRPDTMRALLLACLLALLSHAARAAEPAAAPLAEVERVVGEMRSDPAINGSHLERQLRWKRTDEAKPDRNGKAPHWLRQIATWLGEAGRVLIWVLGAKAIAQFVLFAWRWAGVRSEALRVGAQLRPSHVNELDIRPESLPADIAGSALALSRRGEHRAALSLLYRGALSRLVHDHGAAIDAASTEGECVRLAARALPSVGSAYFTRLVAAWQTEVYAGRGADPTEIVALCGGFDAHLAPSVGTAAHASRAPEAAA